MTENSNPTCGVGSVAGQSILAAFTRTKPGSGGGVDVGAGEVGVAGGPVGLLPPLQEAESTRSTLIKSRCACIPPPDAPCGPQNTHYPERI